MIFYRDGYEEDEEIQMENLEQAPSKFEDIQSTRPHGVSEPWHCGRAEDYLY